MKGPTKKNNSKFPLAEAMRTMKTEPIGGLETIDPRPLEPWRSHFLDKIDLEGDRERAIQEATEFLRTSKTVIYTDASAKILDPRRGSGTPDRKNNTRKT